jgi:hypothetical protein
METVAPLSSHPGFGTWANIATVVTAVAAVLGLGGIVLAWSAATRSRHAALMADISRRWDEQPLEESRRMAAEFVDEPWLLRFYLQAQIALVSDKQFVLQRIPNFFEDLAVQRRARAISFRIVMDTFGWGLVATWDQWEPAVLFLRERENDPTIFEHFEDLAEQLRVVLSG